MTTFDSRPVKQGLYDPAFEHDACGVAFVATLTGVPSHEIVAQALTALRNLDHRGASGAEVDTGDGAGILVQVPDEFLRAVVDFELPAPGNYAVGTAFPPVDDQTRIDAVIEIERIAAEEGLQVLGWRDVPTTQGLIGATALSVEPCFRQIFVAAPAAETGTLLSGMELERLALRPG